MPVIINDRTFYRTAEVCRMSGISRNTLFRWLKAGIIKKPYRDRRGWRMFTEDDLSEIQTEAGRIVSEYASLRGRYQRGADSSIEANLPETAVAETMHSGRLIGDFAASRYGSGARSKNRAVYSASHRPEAPPPRRLGAAGGVDE